MPFDLIAQLATILGGPDGAKVAADLDAAGIPAPSKLGLTQPPAPGADGFAPTTGFMPADQNDPAGAGMAPAAPAAAPAGGSPDLFKLALAGNQGVKAPAPVTPLMNGGVTGGVKAPEMNGKASNGAIAALLSQLGGSQSMSADPLRVPSLAALMQGKK